MLEYSDLINIKNHEPSEKHKRMSINNRSAQFASFKALSGYEDEIEEKGRLTDNKIELSEEEKERINESIKILINNVVEIEYFIKDKFKNGGKYITKTSSLKKIDYINKKIILEDKSQINICDIIDIKKH